MAAIPNTQWVEQTLNDLTPRMAKAINSVFSPFVGGARYLADTAANGEKRNMRDFAKATWGGDGNGLLDFTVGEGDKAMTLNGGKIAATGAGLGLGYRALSGGGVYRDKDGNTDLAGIPFV